LGAQEFAECEAVDARHLEIERDEIATHAFQDAESGGCFVGGDDAILSGLEDLAQPFASGVVIVNN
jgi:hypothetical protein